MDLEQEITLWLGATRYYVGRMTYSVSTFVEMLIKEWPKLDDKTKHLIERELEEKFERDNVSREQKRDHHPLGHDCDRFSWELLRGLWTSTKKTS